ncbi:hypothetical protein CW735_16890 [Alteromonas sp. MB-3u-76]|nr:hypothetical protein CW735_16890 [Alteromonas sp. MB-3u-76]
MTSKQIYKEAFVWIWLPEETQPIVAGRLAPDGDNFIFNYDNGHAPQLGRHPHRMNLCFCLSF